MSKYADIEQIKEVIRTEWVKYMPSDLDVNLSFVLGKIAEMPTIGIVRCKDCRRKDKCEKIVVYEHFCGDIYDAEKIHFCEHGERIEECVEI